MFAGSSFKTNLQISIFCIFYSRMDVVKLQCEALENKKNLLPSVKETSLNLANCSHQSASNVCFSHSHDGYSFALAS